MTLHLLNENLLILLVFLYFVFHAEVGKGADLDHIRKAKVAGAFYTDDKAKLIKEIDNYISSATFDRVTQISEKSRVIGIIAPHAGYFYSGKTAGHAYSWLSKTKAQKVILLGISHRQPLSGFSVFTGKGYETPLGLVENERELSQKVACLLDSASMNYHDDDEHSLEVQMPFVQRALPKAKVIPVICGYMDLDKIKKAGEILAKLWLENKDMVFIASTDMSHFHSDESARKMDKATIKLIEKLDSSSLALNIDSEKSELCGIIPVLILMEITRILNGRSDFLDYSNSSEASLDKKRVVGYCSFGFISTEVEKMGDAKRENSVISEENSTLLLKLARESIELKFENRKPAFTPNEELKKNMGAFVTLNKKGELRGCIGNIIGSGPLWETVEKMARESAFSDPRFPPLKKEELVDLDLEISVLSELMPIKSPDEFKVGLHGILIKKGFRQAVFLPQVAPEQGWDREMTLMHLCAKAGLPMDEWKKDGMDFFVFTAQIINEKSHL